MPNLLISTHRQKYKELVSTDKLKSSTRDKVDNFMDKRKIKISQLHVCFTKNVKKIYNAENIVRSCIICCKILL